MEPLGEIGAERVLKVWDGVRARAVNGERLSFAVVELEPGSIVPEHAHEHEQLGMVVRGTVAFRVGTETRDLGPGGTWRIPSNAPHEVHAGPDGAVVIDVFAPVRDDWERLESLDPAPPRWP